MSSERLEALVSHEEALFFDDELVDIKYNLYKDSEKPTTDLVDEKLKSESLNKVCWTIL